MEKERKLDVQSISIRLLTEEDTELILAFETENREWFEKLVPPRNGEYFSLESLRKINRELVQEQLRGECYLYLIFDRESNLLGRVNLTDIKRETEAKAELGYRIGKAYAGRGIATQAVALVLEQAFKKHQLRFLEAFTTQDNVGSMKAMLKHGFHQVGTLERAAELHGKTVDLLHFKLTL